MHQARKISFEAIAREENQLLTVKRFPENQTHMEGIHERPHIHDFIEILFIVTGSGRLQIDLQVFELQTCRMYFIRPGEVHKVQAANDITGYIISVSGEIEGKTSCEIGAIIYNELIRLLPQQKQLDIHPLYLDDIRDVLDRMIKETFHSHSFSNEIIFRYFNIFLFYLRKQFNEMDAHTIQNRNMQVLQQFKELVNTHYKSKKMVSDYASELNLTPNYLNEIVKKLTGHSAGYLIRQRIALEAKRYALHSGVCMKEIGYHLGFSDMAHFSKFFKSVVGSNFTEFKNARLPLTRYPQDVLSF